MRQLLYKDGQHGPQQPQQHGDGEPQLTPVDEGKRSCANSMPATKPAAAINNQKSRLPSNSSKAPTTRKRRIVQGKRKRSRCAARSTDTGEITSLSHILQAIISRPEMGFHDI